MSIKSAFIAAVLAAGMSTVAVAQEQVDNGGFNGGLGDWSFSSPLNQIASGLTNVGVVDTGVSGQGSIFQVLNLALGSYSFSFDGIFDGNRRSSLFVSIFNNTASQLVLATFTGSNINGSKSFNFDVAEAGDYNLLFLATARGGLGSYVAVDNVSVNAIPVPGPEAGAGLAGLAMAGMYVWASRRRKAQSAA